MFHQITRWSVVYICALVLLSGGGCHANSPQKNIKKQIDKAMNR